MAGRPTGAKRGRPTGRGVSKLANSEGRANGRRLEMPPSLPNGESEQRGPRLALGGQTGLSGLIRCAVCLSDTPRRRTRRTSGVYDSDRVSNGEPAPCLLFPVSCPPSEFLTAAPVLQRILGTLRRTVKQRNPPTRSCHHGESGMKPLSCRKRMWSPRRRKRMRSRTRWRLT